MVDLGGVVGGISRIGAIGRGIARLPVWHRFAAYRNRAGQDSDGIRHGGKPPAAGGGNHDDLPNAPRQTQWTPPYVIGGVAMVLLFAYAFKYGMNDRVSDLVSGVVGVLIGMRIGKRNGAA